jgi:hypothetical protein
MSTSLLLIAKIPDAASELKECEQFQLSKIFYIRNRFQQHTQARSRPEAVFLVECGLSINELEQQRQVYA